MAYPRPDNMSFRNFLPPRPVLVVPIAYSALEIEHGHLVLGAVVDEGSSVVGVTAISVGQSSSPTIGSAPLARGIAPVTCSVVVSTRVTTFEPTT